MSKPAIEGRRTHYRHFPPEYTTLVNVFGDSGSASVGPMTQKQANSSVRDLYRFRQYLSAAVDADPEDDHARSLLTTFNRATLRIEPAVLAEAGRTHLVVLSCNPIVAHFMVKGASI